MQTLERPTPKWFKSLSSNLDKLEANRAAYEDYAEGIVGPSDDVFAAAREFIKKLGESKEQNIDEPRISVSVNGHIGLAFGESKRSLDVLFTPKTHFYFQAVDIGEEPGEGCDKAIELVTRYFRI